MNAVDTNVLVYSLDTSDPVKHAKAAQLLAILAGTRPPALLLWQVTGELLRWLRQWEAAGHVSATDVEKHLRDFLAMFILTLPSPRLFADYFSLYSRFSLSHWDAMLLAACKDAAVTTLYSEDLDPGTDYDGIRVVNPF